MKALVFTALCVFTLLFFAEPIHAQNNFGDFESGIIKGSIDDFIRADERTPLVRFIGILINTVTGVIVVIGVISVVIGGYMYMTAGGDAGRVSQGKVWISSALLGIVIAVTAWIALNTLSPQFTPGVDPLLPPVENQRNR